MPASLLHELGWSPDFADAFRMFATTAVPARIARVDRGAYDAIGPDGPLRAVASLPVARAAAADPIAGPTIGDWVAVEPAGDGGRPVVVAVLPRRTAVIRGGGRRTTTAQLLAANVDALLLATAAVPRAPLNRVERFLTLAWDSDARPVVVLTKTDLATDVPEQLRRLSSAAPGADVVAVSAITGEGLADVLALLGTGVTAALVGASGAGKSTLANALVGGSVGGLTGDGPVGDGPVGGLIGDGPLRTAQLRDDGKGRHATAWRELVVIPSGGVLLDTPGLRGLQLWDAPEALARTFADIAELAVDCKFRDCRHESEPGCAVLAAIDAGLLDPRRVASHAKLQREQAWLANRRDALARIEERRRWKIVHKQMRRGGRDGTGPRP